MSLSSSEHLPLDVQKLQEGFETLLDKIILAGTPIIFSDFVTVNSGVSGLIFDKGRYMIMDITGNEHELLLQEKIIVQNLTHLLQSYFLERLSSITRIQWAPHYRRYTELESGQSQLLLEFRMRESGQLVHGTCDTVNNIYS